MSSTVISWSQKTGASADQTPQSRCKIPLRRNFRILKSLSSLMTASGTQCSFRNSPRLWVLIRTQVGLTSCIFTYKTSLERTSTPMRKLWARMSTLMKTKPCQRRKSVRVVMRGDVEFLSRTFYRIIVRLNKAISLHQSKVPCHTSSSQPASIRAHRYLQSSSTVVNTRLRRQSMEGRSDGSTWRRI